MPSFDILGLGCVAVDDLLYVSAFPQPETKTRVRHHERQGGGLTGTALVAAARLGARCAFAGTLGTEELSQFILDRFRHYGIDTSMVRQQSDVRPIHSFVIVDESQETRTILYDLAGSLGAQPDWPEESVVRSTRVLYVDHYGVEGMIRAARIARQVGIPVVADLENNQRPEFPELLALVDHLIVSQAFATRLTGESTAAKAVEKLWREDRQVAIVTCGSEGSWYRIAGVAPQHQPAFRVPVVDTTGCGDVFHGAYAAALAYGFPLSRRLRFASAAAAIKATQLGGQTGCPTLLQVEQLEQQMSPVPSVP